MKYIVKLLFWKSLIYCNINTTLLAILILVSYSKVSNNIVEFVNGDMPSPFILNSSIVRIYLGALISNQQYDQIFVVAMPLSNAITGTPFREYLEDTMAYASPRFLKVCIVILLLWSFDQLSFISPHLFGCCFVNMLFCLFLLVNQREPSSW